MAFIDDMRELSEKSAAEAVEAEKAKNQKRINDRIKEAIKETIIILQGAIMENAKRGLRKLDYSRWHIPAHSINEPSEEDAVWIKVGEEFRAQGFEFKMDGDDIEIKW